MERFLVNYEPCAKRQCVREEECVQEEDILPNVEVDAVVYAYCQNVSGCARTDDVPLYDSSIHDRLALKHAARPLPEYVRAGPQQTRLLFKYMKFPFDLPEDLVEQYILPKCHTA